MYVRHLQLTDFRSWRELDLTLTPGVTIFSGENGHGKTNIVEALGYLAHLSSHRVNTDAALVREGQDFARISATAVNHNRELTAHLTLRAHGANRASINRTQLASPRELLGIVRTTLFSPEDLALVRGEPEQRRSFLDTIMTARYPRLGGVKLEYDKVLRQRNALLRNNAYALRLAPHPNTATSHSGASGNSGNSGANPDNPNSTDPNHPTSNYTSADSERAAALATLDVWDGQLAALGAQIMSARVQIIHDLHPHLQRMYASLAPQSRPAHMSYTSTINAELADNGILLGAPHADADAPPALLSPAVAEATLLQAIANKREQEIARGTTLIGPHRDDLLLYLGTQPAKGFASHGESWSYALALRLAAFFMQRDDGVEPVVILDDVFAELDSYRRQHLVSLLSHAEQVLITAAVGEDIPVELQRSAKIHHVRAIQETGGAEPGRAISVLDQAPESSQSSAATLPDPETNRVNGSASSPETRPETRRAVEAETSQEGEAHD